MWRRRERAAQGRKLSPTEQLERQLESHAAFEAFGVLLICRALKDFGFAPRDAEVPASELEWQQGGD